MSNETRKTVKTISVFGEDAKEFLQGQLSNDINRLHDEPQILAAWCTPKGRVITLFEVSRSENGFALSVPSELAESTVRRLTMFRFRAKVAFEISVESTSVSLSETIVAGIPYIGLQQTEKYTPHMLNLDLLDAISFDKGCYTGQEIVARTHYKGATKRRTHRFSSEHSVNVGDKISDGIRDIGEVINVSGDTLLAVLPTDKADTKLSIDGYPIDHQPLPYSRNES